MKWTGRFEGYNLASFQKDFISGLIVGVIAIPLGMAFAIASGVKPEYGIYTTIVAGILISLFGGTKFQIGGPTGAFIPILFAIVMQHGYENLLIAGFMAGVILVLMGVFRLGGLMKYIPLPVTIGFTSGIAVTIFSGQISNFLGIENLQKHEYFWPNMQELFSHLSSANLFSVLIALISLSLIVLTPKLWPKIPGPLVGLLVSTVVAAMFMDGRVATIGSTYGAIPSELPQLHIPAMTWDKIELLIGPAFIIAMLGSIESLLSAVVADGMSGGKHNSNRELIGQGIANMAVPLFGGIPATGAIARTATNIKSGAVSPLSGVIHGIVVLLVLILLAPYASHIPLASMTPILMVVAWNMSERKHFVHLLKTKSADSIVLVITFMLTVFADLTTAVTAGFILALVLFMKRMSDMLKIAKVLPDRTLKNGKVREHVVSEGHDCPQIHIYTIEGPLFFGAAKQLEQSLTGGSGFHPKVLVLRMGKVPFMDMTGEASFAEMAEIFLNQGVVLLVTGIQPQPMAVLRKTGLAEKIGENHFYQHTGEAINTAIHLLDRGKCRGCSHFAFRECSSLSCMQSTTDERVAISDLAVSHEAPHLS